MNREAASVRANAALRGWSVGRSGRWSPTSSSRPRRAFYSASTPGPRRSASRLPSSPWRSCCRSGDGVSGWRMRSAAQPCGPPLPAARQEVASAADGRSLYVIGGFDPGRHSSSSVFILTDAWATGPSYPLPIDHAAAAVLDGRLYVAGGFSNGAAQGAVYALDQGAWHQVASLHHPRGALALVGLTRKLYAIGGNAAAGNVAPIEVYDPAADAWTDGPDLPSPRNHLAGFNYQGLVCVAGGRSPNTTRVDCLSAARDTWSRLPDLPFATSGAGAGVVGVDDEVVVAGGEDPNESLLVTQVARLRGNAWSAEAMLVPRHAIQLALFPERLWACGGATAPAYQASAACTSFG